MAADDHFVELVKAYKHDNGFTFKHLVDWYKRHYLNVADANVDQYVKYMSNILIHYIIRYNLLNGNAMAKFILNLSDDDRYSNLFMVKFSDLTDDENAKFNYRLCAACCQALMMTKASDIPYYHVEDTV